MAGLLEAAGRLGRMAGFDPRMASFDAGQKGLAFASRQGSKMGGMDAFRGVPGAKFWGGGALRAGAINATLGGVYGASTDDYDRGGGALRGALMGAGLGVAGRASLQMAKKSDAATRWINKNYDSMQTKATNQFGKLLNKKTGSANWNEFNEREKTRYLQRMGKQMQHKVNPTGPYNPMGPFRNKHMYGDY